MKKNIVRTSCLLVAMSTFTPWLAAQQLRVQVPAVYAENAPVMERVRSECALESMLGNQVFDSVKKRYPDVTQIVDPAKAKTGKVLKLTILTAEGVGGGGWSGAKAMTARAELMQDGVVIQTGVRRDHSRGGVWGGMRSTCSIFETVAHSLGKQFADWLVFVEGGGAPAKAASVTPAVAPAAPATPAAPAAETEAVAAPAALEAAPLGEPPAPAGDNPKSAP